MATFSTASRGVFGRAQREEEVGQTLLLAAKLRVAERNGPLLARRDRKDAGLEQARAIHSSKAGSRFFRTISS